MPRVVSPFGGLVGDPAPSVPPAPPAASFDPANPLPTAAPLGLLGRRQAPREPEMPRVASIGQGFANLGSTAIDVLADRRRRMLAQALMPEAPQQGAADPSSPAPVAVPIADEEGSPWVPQAPAAVPDAQALFPADPFYPAADPGIWW